MLLLEGRLAIVTGAAGGIGFETAKRFVELGATVIVCSRKPKRALQVADKIGAGAIPEELDIADSQSVNRFTARISKKHHHLDILVNNAGYPFEREIWYKKFHEVTDDELSRVIDVDLKGTVRITQLCIPLMKKGGVIISIASTPAIAGHTEGAPYTLAKSALIAMTKHIALEYGRQNIRAFALALGNIATEATFESMTPSERKKAAEENALKRWGRPEEIARTIASLATDDFAFATGNTIIVDGGTVLR
ncbi:MAG TPA: SDR family oxidoreductase [Nitrososphaera sp.]|nr:SDR family oxidoreductase [Nitrososphaera sp.]